MSRLRIAAAGIATAALFGAAAHAQDMRKNEEPRGGSQGQAQGAPEKGTAKQGPSARGVERGNAERAQGAERGPSDRAIEKRSAGQERAQERKEAAPRGDNRKDAERKSAQGAEKANERSKQQRATDDATKTDRKKADTRRSDNRDGTKRAAQPKDDGSRKAATPADAGKTDTTKSATSPVRPPDGKEAKDVKNGKTADDTTRRGDRVQLTEQQRTTIRETIVRERPERVNVRFDIRIGARVPRNVTLRPLPVVLINQFPNYRDYRYIYVEDRIVIVQPTTYEVVEVIEVRDGGTRSASLSLTRDQERFVYETVIDRGPRLSLNLRLGIGAEVPRSVEVQRFPEIVVERVPRLADYRYVIDQDQVVVLSPSDYEIALVISR